MKEGRDLTYSRLARCHICLHGWRKWACPAFPRVPCCWRTSAAFKTTSRVNNNNNNNNSNCDAQASSFIKNAGCLLIDPVLQREAESLNQTTQEELSSANQTLLLEEVTTAVEAMSAVNLAAARAAANQESRCVSQSHVTSLII